MNTQTDQTTETTENIGALVEQGKELAGNIRDQALATMKATHKAVQENPYKVAAIALGIGALIGFFLRWGSSGKTE